MEDPEARKVVQELARKRLAENPEDPEAQGEYQALIEEEESLKAAEKRFSEYQKRGGKIETK